MGATRDARAASGRNMLFEPLFKHATTKPQAVAAIDDRGQVTYQQIAAMATGLGVDLADQTAQPRVGLLLPRSAGFAASFSGTLLAGTGVVRINFLLGDREIAHVIADSGIDTVVTIPQLAPRLKETRLKVIDLTALPPTPPPNAPTPPAPAAGDTAVLIYTRRTPGLLQGQGPTHRSTP